MNSDGDINVDFIHKCKCCLDDTELKGLWDVHDYDGEQEIYGYMLTECFALPWEPVEEAEYICKLCVSRLREAVQFKQEILATEEVLLNEATIKNEKNSIIDEETSLFEDLSQVEYEAEDHYETENYYEAENHYDVKESKETIIKYEDSSTMDDTSILEDCTQYEYVVENQIERDTGDININGEEIETLEDFAGDLEFEEIEYLDSEDGNRDLYSNKDSLSLGPATPFSSQGPSTPDTLSQDAAETSGTEGPKRKWPKKKKKSERTKQYKQYTPDDLKQAINAVRSGEMTCTNAAVKFGIPKKTLTIKVNQDDNETKERNDSQHKLIEEVKTLLTHTSALPFKTKTTRYYCFYCSTDGPHFEEPEELREHTITKHGHEFLKIELHMRPQWLHELIKLDVEDLHCTTCHILLPDWNFMFRHLSEIHNLEFDQAFSRAIPYALDSDLKCVLCHQGFHNFGHLDAHMNSHYSNYICYECGDTFLSVSRLDKHLNVHKVGNYPCPKCDKMFTLEKYRSRHISLVHNQDSTVKCLYCPEKFVGLFQRHVHVSEHHKEKLKLMTCEYCGKCYTWKPYFLAHVRRRHGTERNYKCKYCAKSFLMRYELKNHMVRHTKEKNYLCGQCGESFAYKLSLKKHLESHNDH